MNKEIKLNLSENELRALDEFVLLDTASTKKKHENSYLFTEPIDHITAFNLNEIDKALKQLDYYSNKGYWLAGYIRYDCAAAFSNKKNKKFKEPLVWFGVYKKPKLIDRIKSNNSYPSYLRINTDIKKSEYIKSFNKIKKYLFNGNTYQVNYTIDKSVKAYSSDENLYLFLRKSQKTPYCSFIKNKYDKVLCFSPELFFLRDKNVITAKPMKGTLKRGRTKQEDKFYKNFLKTDEKNRAENLMIVDLLRNDIGRISKPGLVKVTSMFDIETHPTLHQMTSCIKGELKKGYGYKDIFKMLFPCGSVTGAPKLKTMQIIDEIEKGQRGIYCGAIGYISPEKKAVFNVPIRILQKKVNDKAWQYRVGSGIVWDSVAQKEWDEVNLKSDFLSKKMPTDFQMLETMLWDKGNILYEKEHFMRLEKSCKFFGYYFSTFKYKKNIKSLKNKLPLRSKKMIRLLISKNGEITHQIKDIAASKEPFIVKISSTKLDKHNIFLKHKTTYRPWYEKTMQKLTKKNVFDEIFLNNDLEVCEGARTNIFVKIKGTLYTPPLKSGLLGGILRQKLIDNKKVKEKVLYLEDLKNADDIFCGNSVRGLVKICLKGKICS